MPTKKTAPLELCSHPFWFLMLQNYVFIHCVPQDKLVILWNALVT